MARPYNLPAPWDPGFAMPKNALDEGLERRALVTKQAPRGTYDQPAVGGGGYAVPEYVMDEGYGQGAFTTSWMRRGSQERVPYPLNQHPHARVRPAGRGVQRVSFAGLGDIDATALPSAYRNFGARAAQRVLAHVGALPPPHRKAALRQVLDQIDPALWGRVDQLAQPAVRAGVHPTRALSDALGHAMAAGMAAEVVKVGRSRRAPQARSLLGLGCYGPQGPGASGLGAVMQSLGDAVQSLIPSSSTTTVGCTGYSWNAATGGWQRTRAGQADVPGPNGSGCTTTITVHTGGNAATAQATQQSQAAMRNIQYVSIGPFTLAYDATGVGQLGMPVSMLTPAMADAVNKAAADATNAAIHLQQVELAASGGAIALLTLSVPGVDCVTGYGNASAERSKKLVTRGEGNYAVDVVIHGKTPIFKYKHPVTGKSCGLFLSSTGTAEKPRILLKGRTLSMSDKLWSGITSLASSIVGTVSSAVSDVAGLACQLVSSQAGVAAGAAVGAAVGNPAAGQVGAQIASGMCASPAGSQGLLPAAPSSNLLPLAIAAGGIGLVFLVTKKKAK